MPSLRDYLFVDQQTLDDYLEQFSSLQTEDRSRSAKLGISFAGPSAESTTSSRYRPKTRDEKIRELLKYVTKEKIVGRKRPKEMYASQPLPPFMLETLIARKVILPTKLVESMSGVKHLAVWISDPDSRFLVPENDIDYIGSFLYLTEMHLDQDNFHTVFSGCSALQAIANAASGLPLLDRSHNNAEALGRGSYLHPVEKLASLGATIGDERKIECLYRVRYMTDEQCFTANGKKYRVNDILGYPIYITQALSK